jgi:DNA-binding GntR family transcriptional regulator
MIDQEKNAPMPKSVSLVQQAYILIEEMIIKLALAPGEVVSENSLTQRLSIGRTPVREALQQLEREGLVLILPKRGILVSQIDIGRQIRMLEFRRSTERFIVQAAAQRATDKERQMFRDFARRLEQSGLEADGQMFLKADDEFTQALANCARNEFAASALKLTHGLSRRFAHAFDSHWITLAQNTKLHAALAIAIAEGDPNVAAQRLDALIDAVEAFTRGTLDRP